MNDPDPCYAAAMRILRYRFNSTAELRRKLRSKKFDDASIDETIVRLRDEKWLDDRRFAASFVRARQQRKIGSRRIVRELQAAGVSDETAKLAVRENADPERERDDLIALAEKRRRLLIRRHGEAYVASAEGRNKLLAFLLKQGYDSALVTETFRDWSAAGLGSDS